MRKVITQSDPNDIEIKYKVVDFGNGFTHQQTTSNASPAGANLPRYPEREIVEYESK
jgi:hypothetical protein